MAESSGENIRNNVTATLSGLTVHVPDRVANSHRKASSPRPATHETHTVVSQATLENTRITRKRNSNSQILVPSFTMVATGRQCSHRPTITPNKACSANLYRRIERRVGRSLKRIHCQRDLVTARKQAAYKLFRTQGSVSGLKRVSKPLCKQDSTCGNRQYYSDVVYKQGRGHEVGHTLCPTMENLDLVCQTSSNSKSLIYPRAVECGSRQAIQTGPDHSNRMVPPSRGFSSYMQQVAPTSDRSICHEVQQQFASVRFASTGLPSSSSGCTKSAMGEPGRIRRSEIHAWQNRNIRHQSDWSKVSLYPSPSFVSKNQLAKEGPECVAPVVIPALAPTLDKSPKSDRSLCSVRALRYYLDRTSDIRQNKELVFVSFKKGFDKDISPATISSWIKQTVILCYELSDQEAHTLHQVKAHDVRAFAASKAFQSGICLEQILSACHWKSHNTFTQFYLKDVAWADSELYHLGPVVAAQQIHK